MALNNVTFNSDAIQNKGGLKWAIKKINYDGSAVGGETWTDWTYRDSSDIAFNQPLTPNEVESGDVPSYEPETIKTEFKITASQSDAKILTFLKDECGADYYYSLYMDLGKDSTSARQYLFAPIIQIDRGYTIKYPGRRPEITIKPLYNASAFSLSASSISSGSISAWGGAGTQAVPAGAYFSVTAV